MKSAGKPDLRSVWLAAGAHPAPRRGVCVVELASMLAGEEFSDRPGCVCPVIGGFLRGFNDRLAYFDRQFLLPYAELIVGSRAGRHLTRERRRICMDWVTDAPPRLLPRMLARLRVRVRIVLRGAPLTLVRPSDGIGDHAAELAIARGDEEAGFELLERLLETVPWLEREEPEAIDEPRLSSDPLDAQGLGLPAAGERRPTHRRTGRFRVHSGALDPDRGEPAYA